MYIVMFMAVWNGYCLTDHLDTYDLDVNLSLSTTISL